MPNEEKEITEIKESLDYILEIKEPPVARCRLMSEGIKPYHSIFTESELAGSKTCLACGLCMDACPVIRREPERKDKTPQKTSMALEAIVGEDCEKCFSCALTCPQVDTCIKDYIINSKVKEVIPQVKTVRQLDPLLTGLVAFLFGIILGFFLGH